LKKAVARTYTGIPGLDEMLGGGFPQGRVLLVLGEPGAGKTILCSQFLANGLDKFGESGLFVSMEENRTQYEREMAQFGWDFSTAEKHGKYNFVDVSPIRTIPGEVRVGKLTLGKQDFSLMSLLEVIRSSAKAIDARRIVVDPISLLIFQYLNEAERRKALMDLVEALAETGATCLLSSELRRVGARGRILQIEEYLVHGVILMQTSMRESQQGKPIIDRVMQVEKMRETMIDREPRLYKIMDKGIEVYARQSVI
jgi:KaiC/GvpD/RAD55 family RecA-like ATPase